MAFHRSSASALEIGLRVCSTVTRGETVSVSSVGESWDEKRERMKRTGDPSTEVMSMVVGVHRVVAVDLWLGDDGCSVDYRNIQFYVFEVGARCCETFCSCFGGSCWLTTWPNISFHDFADDERCCRTFCFLFSLRAVGCRRCQTFSFMFGEYDEKFQDSMCRDIGIPV